MNELKRQLAQLSIVSCAGCDGLSQGEINKVVSDTIKHIEYLEEENEILHEENERLSSQPAEPIESFKGSNVCGCGKEGRYVDMSTNPVTFSCTKYGRCPDYGELSEKVTELENCLRDYRQAMELTRQYVGKKTLPSTAGCWWFDADQNAKEILGMKK